MLYTNFVLWENHSCTEVLIGRYPVSFVEASLCCREAGEKEKESARGTVGRGKSPLPIVPRALSIFSIIAIFIGILSGSLCGAERADIP